MQLHSYSTLYVVIEIIFYNTYDMENCDKQLHVKSTKLTGYEVTCIYLQVQKSTCKDWGQML